MFVFFLEAATVVKMSTQRNISEEEEGVPGGQRTRGLGTQKVTGMSAFCLLSVSQCLSFPVCKMGARRLKTYIRATGMQYFVKALKKHSGWQSTMGAQTASSLSKLLRVKT